jgi:glutamate synthase domain-containing protein 2
LTLYRCNVCNVFEYDSNKGRSNNGIKSGTLPAYFPEDWRCPICRADKTHLKIIEEIKLQPIVHPIDLGSYLGEWRRQSDEIEKYMHYIHTISANGESIIEPMRTTEEVISWDQILLKGAQLARIPLNMNEEVNTRAVIGPNAKQPLIIETPILISHMSFGALSKEAKIALAKGSSAVKTAIGSGEGGILKESRENAYKYIFEYVPNKYSVTDSNLKNVDAIEIKFGQSVKPGMGGHLPASKVTEEIGKIRGFPPGIDIVSPSHFSDIKTKEELLEKVRWLRKKSDGKPIGIKFAAGAIEEDLKVALFAEPDFITIDGRPGSTGAAPKFIKDATSIPTIFALYRAKQYFEKEKIKDVSLIITGG